MERHRPQSSLTEGNRRAEEIDLVECWHVVRRRGRFVLTWWLTAVLLALVVSLLLPKRYESTATVLPQVDYKEGGNLAMLLAASTLGSAAQSMGLSLPGLPSTPTDVFVAILKSRVMADAVIEQFKLRERYETDTMLETRKTLRRRTKVKVTKEKVIEVTVEADDAVLAAEMANFYVAHLDRLNQVVSVSKAGQHRQFIERRVQETLSDLVKAEEALRDFQTRNKTVAVDAQSKAMIEAAAQLQAQISAQEVQLEMMGSYLLPDNPELARARTALTELKRQLALLESGKDGKGMIPGDRLHPAMITVPGLALEYGRLMRELKVQETLYALLTAQYEQAKLAEARDTPTVQVLDLAVVPDKHTRPDLPLNLLLAGSLGLASGIVAALMGEHRARRRRSAGGAVATEERLEEFERHVLKSREDEVGVGQMLR